MFVRIVFVLFTLFSPLFSWGQGSFVLVGGGSEKDDSWSWSNAPYTWMLDQVDDKNVAIISYQESSDPQWLVDYFESLGANDAENFVIESRNMANDAAILDQIKMRDVIFLKGGDQGVYYDLYNDTGLEATIVEIYEDGGVIAGTSAGMAILSSPFYSAENGTIYPDEALEKADIGDSDFRSDFLPFNQGFLFDTHFLERGRHARLMSFLGNINSPSDITGIGVDDQTAFCIDHEMQGIVYGTGAVSVVHLNDFQDLNGKPVGQSNVTQLLHGDQIDLNSFEIQASFDFDASPEPEVVNGIYDVHLAASISLTVNQFWLEERIAGIDTIAILTSSSSSDALDYVKFLDERVENIRLIRTTVQDSCDRAADINFVSGTHAFLWVGNELNQLSEFLNSDPAGKVLNESMRNDSRTHIFIGEDSDLAGAVVATNRTADPLNSFYGDLEFDEGLKLVPDMMIVSELYDPSSTSLYENNTSSLIYGIFQNPLSYSLGLNERSFASIVNENGERKVSVSGEYSGLFIQNTASLWSAANQPVNASGDSRQAVGFDQLQFNFLAEAPLLITSSTSDNSFIPNLVLEQVENLSYSFDEGNLLLNWDHAEPEAESFLITHEDQQIAEVNGNERSFVWSEFENGQISVVAQSAGKTSCEVVVDVSITSSEELKSDDNIQIFPNPAIFDFTIIIPRPGRVQIHDLQGLRVLDMELGSGDVINVTNWTSGVYILNYCDVDICLNRKIIVQRNAK